MVKRTFRVTLEMPKGVTPDEMAEYIATEVRSGTGCLLPTDPLWQLDRDTVTVTYTPRKD